VVELNLFSLRRIYRDSKGQISFNVLIEYFGNDIWEWELFIPYQENPEIEDEEPEIEISIIDHPYNLERYEKSAILQALQLTEWSQHRAAKLLKMSQVTLHRRIKKYGIKHHNWKKNV